MTDALKRLGWDESHESNLAKNQRAARVVAEHGFQLGVATVDGEEWVDISSKFKSLPTDERPAIGDFVGLVPGLDRSVIESVLPRRTVISRAAAGRRSDRQILAANIDFVGCTVAANLDRLLGRVERYVISAWDSGAEPIVVVSKIDLIENRDEVTEQLSSLEVPVLLTSSATGEGMAELRAVFASNRTGVLLGPSGIGKSSLVNHLVEDADLAVHAERDSDHRGRHTTTSRQLVALPEGGAIIDTPGLRELQLWDETSIDKVFQDIEDLVAQCRFNDCEHRSEPGCAIKPAIEEGVLSFDRFERYLKLRIEAEARMRRKEAREALDSKRSLRTKVKSTNRAEREADDPSSWDI